MISRVVFALFSVMVLFGAMMANAAPLGDYDKRQIGDLQCNINRFQIVTDLAEAKVTANALTKNFANDAAGSSAIATVSQGISSAQSAIGEIAIALLTGQQAPTAARDQVEAGLTSATEALANLSSTNSQTTNNLSKIKQQLSNAATAGNGVLANCN